MRLVSGYNDGAAYVFDADENKVERLGIVPKKKRVVLTDKELFEDDILAGGARAKDEEDEDFPRAGSRTTATTRTRV